jgi:ubiquinone/menaquinone biosynthesis C-methylase UbiE
MARFESAEFRKHWLGLTAESKDFLAQQLRVFGELLGTVTQSLSGWRILDVGCGDGRWLRRMVDYDACPEDVVGIDINDIRLQVGRAKNPLVRLLQTDGYRFPFEDEQFDLVTQFVCFSNIPTINLRKHTANEIARVLKQGGYIFWWDLFGATSASDRGAPINPADYFHWTIKKIEIGRHPKPSQGLRSFPGYRFIGQFLDYFGYPPTHTAALIGPKR